MKKNLLIGIVVIVAIGVVACIFINHRINTIETPQQAPEQQTVFDGKNSTFTIDNESITLVNGVSEKPIENSSAKVVTNYFGNEAIGDLNGDGLPDQAFLISHSTGGTGKFYYVVVALKTPTGYKTTNAFYIGDRIAPQSTEIHSDSQELHVNYADHKFNESFGSEPSEGKVLLLKVTPNGVLEGLMK